MKTAGRPEEGCALIQQPNGAGGITARANALMRGLPQALFFAGCIAACAANAPLWQTSRQDEDWSVLRAQTNHQNLFDPVKLIPLNHDGTTWLTLGGEVSERYEYFDNYHWGKGPQDDNGYLLQRYMIHLDAL